MKILGISAYYHDSAATLVEGGRIVAAAQEERFTRVKHDASFPFHAISYCLQEAGVEAKDIDHVAFYDKPFLKFERLLETYIAFAPKGFTSFRAALPVWLKEKLFQKSLLAKQLQDQFPDIDWSERLLFSEHHQSHAASAYFPSPFEEAAVLTMDGVGEWATTSAGIGRGHSLEIQKEIHFPHSLGLLYSAFTYYAGFKVNSGEYKLMGLAPYGNPQFVQTILENLVDLKDDGSFRINMEYFDYCTGLRMTNRRFEELFDAPPRNPEELIEQRHMDLAASIQAVTEEVVLRLTRDLSRQSGMVNLCLAGGVALNCVANGKVLRDGEFNRVWVQPAAGDAGGSLGAALSAYHSFKDQPRHVQTSNLDNMNGAYLGPEFSQKEIEERLLACGAQFVRLGDDSIISDISEMLSQGMAVGWFQGRMEFGPRALGNRSILGDPRSSSMQSILNLKVKFRESFRPFAPAILRDDVSDWFEIDADSPYMLMVADIVPERRRDMTDDEQRLFGIEKLNVSRSQVPAVTHVDYSARIQTVHRETNPRFHALLSSFREKTGCPILVNTSFNVRGEPLVCTPEDAFRCFMGTDLDVLAIGNCILRKEAQDQKLRINYKDEFELD